MGDKAESNSPDNNSFFTKSEGERRLQQNSYLSRDKYFKARKASIPAPSFLGGVSLTIQENYLANDGQSIVVKIIVRDI